MLIYRVKDEMKSKIIKDELTHIRNVCRYYYEKMGIDTEIIINISDRSIENPTQLSSTTKMKNKIIFNLYIEEFIRKFNCINDELTGQICLEFGYVKEILKK